MLKKIKKNDVIKIVSLEDPSINLEKSNIEKYDETLDIKHLAFNEGETPTYFLVGNISEGTQAAIQDKHYQIEFPDQKKLHGDALKDAKPQIKTVEQTQMILTYFYAACKQYEEEGKVFDMEEGIFPFRVIQELGAAIMTRTALGDEEKKH